MIAAATAPDINKMVINVGSGQETSVRELAEMVLDNTGNKAEMLFTPRNDPGASRMCADLKLAKEKLNYNVYVNLEEGLKLTLEKDKRFSIE